MGSRVLPDNLPVIDDRSEGSSTPSSNDTGLTPSWDEVSETEDSSHVNALNAKMEALQAELVAQQAKMDAQQATIDAL